MTEDRKHGEAVLVVDDEALIRMHAAGLLEEAGYRVQEAADAASALRILEADPTIRLLFTDLQMPGDDDGLALAEKVHKRWPQILLLITSAGKTLSESEIPDSGEFLPKPYTGEVVDRVSNLLSKKPS